jgi:5-methylcytosine-specific restriction endonuclease McrA
MKKLNRVFRNSTGRQTSGVSLVEKSRLVIELCGEVVPPTRKEVIERACFLLRNFNANGELKAGFSKPEKAQSPQKPKRAKTRKSDGFYSTWEWKQVRYEALRLHGRRCQCCGWRPGDTEGGRLVVDHIKPRSKFPSLELDVGNLQVLCNDCNQGKSNVYTDDYRNVEDWFSSFMRDHT